MNCIPPVQRPQIEGGQASLYERMQYPPDALAEGIEGMVAMNVWMDEEGEVTKAEVATDAADSRLQAEALRLIRTSRYVPETTRRGRDLIRIHFRLRDQ